MAEASMEAISQALKGFAGTVEKQVDKEQFLKQNFLTYNKQKKTFLRRISFTTDELEKIWGMSLHDLKKLEEDRLKEEKSLRNFERSVLKRVARQMYAAQGGVFSALGEFAAGVPVVGPALYIIMRIIEEAYKLMMMADRVETEAFQVMYGALGSAGEFTAGLHGDLPKLFTRLQYITTSLGLDVSQTRSMIQSYAASGGGVNLSGNLIEDADRFRRDVIEPSATFGTLFKTESSDLSSLLGSFKFETGRSASDIRSMLTIFYNQIKGVGGPITEQFKAYRDVMSELSVMGGASISTRKYVAKIIKSSKGSKSSLEAFNKLKPDPNDIEKNLFIMRASLEGGQNRALRNKFRAEITEKIDSFGLKGAQKTAALEALKVLDKLDQGKRINQNDQQLLQIFVEPNEIRVEMIEKTISAMNIKEAFPVVLKSFFGMTETEFYRLKDATKVELEPPDSDFIELLSLSKDVNFMQMSLTQYIESKFRQMKLELLMPAFNQIAGPIADFLHLMASSDIFKFMFGDWEVPFKPGELPIAQKDLEHVKSLHERSVEFERKWRAGNRDFGDFSEAYSFAQGVIDDSKKFSDKLRTDFMSSKIDLNKPLGLEDSIQALSEIIESRREMDSEELRGLIRKREDLMKMSREFYDRGFQGLSDGFQSKEFEGLRKESDLFWSDMDVLFDRSLALKLDMNKEISFSMKVRYDGLKPTLKNN